MTEPDEIDLRHPANAGILNYLRDGPEDATRPPHAVPADAVSPYSDLGTHPDVTLRLWDQLGAALPEDCRRVAHGRPVLLHPRSGVIFGVARGTSYVLRLPPEEREQAMRAGAERIHSFPAYPALGIAASVLDLDAVGEEWVFGAFLQEEGCWCRAAYLAAGLA